jgi:hypothetical protein
MILALFAPCGVAGAAEGARAQIIVNTFMTLCPPEEDIGDREALFERMAQSGIANPEADDFEMIIRSHTPFPIGYPIETQGEAMEAMGGAEAVPCGLFYEPVAADVLDAAITERLGVAGERRETDLMPNTSYPTGRGSARVGPAPHTVWTIQREGEAFEIVSFTELAESGRDVLWIRHPVAESALDAQK